MEGYLIRVPGEACDANARPAWRVQGAGDDSVQARVLYYVLEAGELCGYASPEDGARPLETFQLTSHRVDVNVMYSMNVFELSARAVPMQATTPPRRVVDPFAVDDTSSSDSSSDDELGRNNCHAAQQAALQAAQEELTVSPVEATSSTGESFTGSFRVVFFAANKELVKTWSTKLLNWNRHVFETSEVSQDVGPAELQQANDDVVQALEVINAKNMFLRPIELRAPPDPVGENVDKWNDLLSTHPASSRRPTFPGHSSDTSIIIKPRDPVAPTSTPWWLLPFIRYKRVSAYSLGH